MNSAVAQFAWLDACEVFGGAERDLFVVDRVHKRRGPLDHFQAIFNPFAAAPDLFGDGVDAGRVGFDHRGELLGFLDGGE